MKQNSGNTWFSAPTAGNLAAAWVVGIGGCDILAWLGMNVFPGHIFRILAVLCMLLTGVAVWRRWYPGKIAVFSLSGWRLGLIILPAFLLHPVIGGALPSVQFVWGRSSLVMLLWCVIMIGLGEELWWRGIWFEIWEGRPVMCILAGSLLFTAYHYPFQGLEPLPMVFCFGLVYGAARYRGASIGVLALAHGLIDWIQGMGILQWPEPQGLASQSISIAAVSLVILAVMLAVPRLRRL